MRWANGIGAALLVVLGCGGSEPAASPVSVGESTGPNADSGTRDPIRRRPIGTSTSNNGGDGSIGLTGAPEDSGKLCDTDADCGLGTVCFQGTCVGQGALRFSLSWTEDTDLDLHVLTPSGVEISYLNPIDDGGLLDVDDCIASACRVPNGTHIENVFFDGEPTPGTYFYWVENFSGDVEARFELVVSESGTQVAAQSGLAPILEPAESPRYRHTF